MKKIIVLIISLFSILAQATVWVDEPTKTVSVLPTPLLTIEVTETEADPEMWASVIVSWRYNIASFREELENLKSEYRGFKVKRAETPKVSSEVYLLIPGLQPRKMEIQNTPEGPQISYQGFFTKKEWLLIRKLDWKQVSLTGNQKVRVESSVIKDEVNFSPLVCVKLRGNVADTILELSALIDAAKEQGSIKSSAFGAKVVSEVLSQCLSLDTSWGVRVKSIKDFLALTFVSKQPEAEISVREIGVQSVVRETPLTWKLEEK